MWNMSNVSDEKQSLTLGGWEPGCIITKRRGHRTKRKPMGETYPWNKLNLRYWQDPGCCKCDLEFKNDVRLPTGVLSVVSSLWTAWSFCLSINETL